LASGRQSLNVPATQTVAAVGWVNSKATGINGGPALWALSWFLLCFIEVCYGVLLVEQLRKTFLGMMGKGMSFHAL